MNITGLSKKVVAGLSVAVLFLGFAAEALAHGERAQLASMRMRTVHWFDTEVTPTNVKVGEIVTLTGKFVPSIHWPEQLPSVADTVFLNIGVPGPTFIRIHSEVNGVPMIRSTAFYPEKVYEYKVVVRARIPGRYHVHPLLNVKDAGTLVGKGTWLEVKESDSDAPFVNNVTTMLGDTIDLETYGLANVKWWSGLWLIIGLAYLLFWLVRKELFIPRFIRINNLGQDKANSLITRKDFVVTAIFFTVTLGVMLAGYLWAEKEYPITIPLQTGKVEVPAQGMPVGDLNIEMESASYSLPQRNLTMRMKMTNSGTQPLRIAEFITANIRFMNPEVDESEVVPGEEMVSRDGLTVSRTVINPGEQVDVEMVATDALWEKYRMTGLIYDPDSRFAGMVFYYDESGNRYFQEIGGPILPSFF